MREHLNDPRWGAHAQRIDSGEMWAAPRGGGHDDHAHPPIHPTRWSAPDANQGWHPDKRRLYEFIVRSFLASCSKPAVGFETQVEFAIAEESFRTTGMPHTSSGGGPAAAHVCGLALMHGLSMGASKLFCPSMQEGPCIYVCDLSGRMMNRGMPQHAWVVHSWVCSAGLMVRERNWMKVFPWARWGGNDNLPPFDLNQTFMPTELLLKEVQPIPSKCIS